MRETLPGSTYKIHVLLSLALRLAERYESGNRMGQDMG